MYSQLLLKLRVVKMRFVYFPKFKLSFKIICFFNDRFLLVVLSLWMLEYSSASDLECSYSYNAYGYYTCMTMNLKLEKENALIESVKGQHLPGKEPINVEGLLIVYSKNKFLSSDIFEKFPNLKVLSMLFFSVENIVQGNFDGAQKLEYIYLNNNGIPKLNDNIFSGATELIRMKLLMYETQKSKLEFKCFH